MNPETEQLIRADQAHLWHPFTQMSEWCAPGHEPLVLAGGEGALLRDTEGREYIDGNSSIWTNIHGHNHPKINAAIREQLDCVAHTSFLGFTNPPAIRLAAELVNLFPPGTLTRVFYGDDGSTAIEVALKMAAQYWQLQGEPRRKNFVAFTNAYHGDTMGAASLGGVKIFHDRFAAWHFPVEHVSSVAGLDTLAINPDSVAAVIIEPLIQGAAGMRLWPRGMLVELRKWCDANGALLILDEVMTGFGRTGTMFACEQENVTPDFIALAKGLTGGYMPLAATLTTEKIFSAFLGTHAEQKTLYYGHSYAGNQLGCAAALASLAIFREEKVLDGLQRQIALLTALLTELAKQPRIADVRQCGFIAGIEIAEAPGKPCDPALQMGARVCMAARQHGLLTRPIRDTIVLMPPYCITDEQLCHAVGAISSAMNEVC
ncbi:MAG TPA: adenosylmethionine--8-amino-7-oxononanoate transaminase [Chthoniobacteraceae bacterium]|nr:adenosylmethionine--8-amino-7-oxononanoate transaminase [Chthoniobacteraceae bacterium]